MNTRQIQKRIDTIAELEGRRPRVLLAPLKSALPDRWTKPLAAFLAECGFDVDIGPSRQTPVQAARLAVDNDVHMMCVAVGDVTDHALVVELAEALAAEGGTDILLVAGGAGKQPNQEELDHAGVDLIVDYDRANMTLVERLLDLLDAGGATHEP